jgi:hypothetical protein
VQLDGHDLSIIRSVYECCARNAQKKSLQHEQGISYVVGLVILCDGMSVNPLHRLITDWHVIQALIDEDGDN